MNPIIKKLVKQIDREKRKKNPNKQLMRGLLQRIQKLADDGRALYTGQDDRFMVHTDFRDSDEREE
jgi:hypothetical protein